MTLHASFLTLDTESASARVRILQHQAGLAAEGIEATIHQLPRGTSARRRLFRQLGESDAVVLHRVLLGEGDMVALRRAAKALALDLDDAVHRRPHGRPTGLGLEGKFQATIQAVDLVVCANEHLRAEMRAHHPRIRLLPPASPAHELAPKQPHDGPLRLVWTGSRSTLPYLESIAPALEALGDAVSLEVLADARPTLRTPFTFTPWSLAAEEAALARADVGLYPLTYDAWTEGKSAYKLHRYMQFALPSVASPRGGSEEALAPPEAGLLAESPKEWEETIRRLGTDHNLRRSMGIRARGRALARHSLADRTRSLGRILRELAELGRRRADKNLEGA